MEIGQIWVGDLGWWGWWLNIQFWVERKRSEDSDTIMVRGGGEVEERRQGLPASGGCGWVADGGGRGVGVGMGVEEEKWMRVKLHFQK